MIEYAEQILNNNQFKALIQENFSGSSFLFESTDTLYLENFVYSFAKFLMCSNRTRPCENCNNCKKANLLSHPDIIIYPQSKDVVLVEDVKNLINSSILSPMEGDKKIFIFKNFSSANIQSQNKLLKVLEEPPKNVYILLCVNNISKILPTILSRCQKINLKSLSNKELSKYLNFSNFSPEDISKIISSSNGNLTVANNYLKNPLFLKVYDNCLNILKNMRSSKELLKFSYLITKNKEEFELSLKILENFYRDLLLIRLNKNELVTNTFNETNLKEISLSYNCDTIDKIIKKIYQIKKQMEFNCNYVLLCDNLLLYILEVKFLCKK